MVDHEGASPSKPDVLIVASCHGRQMMDYIRMRSDITKQFNASRIDITHFKLLHNNEGYDAFSNTNIVKMLHSAQYIFSYNLGPRHGNLSIESMRRYFDKNAKVLTFVAPICSCFWPWSYGYTGGIGIASAIDRGLSKEEIWEDFNEGAFDPLFGTRWRLEFGRLAERSLFHDISIHNFCLAHYITHKLWMANNHPTFTLLAYITSKLFSAIGLRDTDDAEILGLDYKHRSMEALPETDYEFDHYKFSYPKRHPLTAQNKNAYLESLNRWHNHYINQGLEHPESL